MSDPLIETNGLTKHFTAGSGFISRYLSPKAVHAVDDVSLSIEPGQTLGLVGESGCGKSTLGRTLLRLHEPTSGSIRFDGTDLTSLSQRQLRPYRREMQMVFQDPQSSLNPRMTVGEILRKPIEFHGIAKGEAALDHVHGILDDVGLPVDNVNRYVHEFSGGQQQRIGLARALALEPKFIVLDEPTSALDVSVQAKILRLIAELKEKYELTLVFISHDLNVIRHVCDEVAVMYLGEIVEQAPAGELFDTPAHPYTKALLDSISLPDPDLAGEIENPIEGNIPSPIDPPTGCRFHTRCPRAMECCRTETPDLHVRSVDASKERVTACHLYD